MFVRTDRLLLRPGWREDAPQLHSAIADWSVVRNLSRVPWPYRPEDAEAFVSLPHDDAAPHFLVFRRTFGAPELIGGVGLKPLDDGRLELGYWIARAHWGLGYATEAAAAVVRLADAHRLPELVSGHLVDNPASGRVLRKLGFVPTGRTRPIWSTARQALVPMVEYDRAIAEEQLAA